VIEAPCMMELASEFVGIPFSPSLCYQKYIQSKKQKKTRTRTREREQGGGGVAFHYLLSQIAPLVCMVASLIAFTQLSASLTDFSCNFTVSCEPGTICPKSLYRTLLIFPPKEGMISRNPLAFDDDDEEDDMSPYTTADACIHCI
jgi:hypothetical protein